MRVRLKVIGPDQRPTEIDVDAASEMEAMRTVVGRGLRVLGIETLAGDPARAETGADFPLLLFSQELLALLEAGLTLGEAMVTLHLKEKQPAVKATLGQVREALSEGKNFSDALSHHASAFPEVYVATVRAAERTGNLPTALARFVAYQLQFDAIRRKVVAASIYPVMLMVVGGLVSAFLLGYVVPKFSMAYETAGRDIPLASQWLLGIGRVIHDGWPLMAALLAAALVLGLRAFRDPALRRRAIVVLTRLPWLSDKADGFRLARYFGAASLLLTAGVPLARTFPMLADLLSPRQQVALDRARRDVEEGKVFSAALVAHRLADPVAESLIRVGERSGRLAEMLDRAARFHDEEFARWLDWLMRLLEPALMALLGVVVGGIVVLMYMPIFDLAGSLQ